MADAPFRLTPATLAVLEALLATDEELYGRQIVESTGHQSGAVNPILRRLEQHGWAVARWEGDAERPTGPRRRFYRIAPGFVPRVRAILVNRGRIPEPPTTKSLLAGRIILVSNPQIPPS